MEKGERRLVLFLFIIILVFSCFLIYKIKSKPKYDKELYNEIYTEYKELLENSDKDSSNIIASINDSDEIKKDNKVYVSANKNGKEYRVIRKYYNTKD